MHMLHTVYASLLVAPYDLCAEYSYNCIPMVNATVENGGVVAQLGHAWFAKWIIMHGTILVCVCVSWRRKDASLFTALCWLLIPFLPFSNLIITVGTLIGERLLYLPSIGFCVILSRGICTLPNRMASFAVFGAIACAYISKTWLRNEEWATDKTLFLSAARVCPQSAKHREKLGGFYFAEFLQGGKVNNTLSTLALAEYEKARAIDSALCDTGYSIAKYHIAMGDVFTALSYLIENVKECIYSRQSAFKTLQLLWGELTQIPGPNGAGNGTLFELMADVMLTIEQTDTGLLYFREAAAKHVQSSRFPDARRAALEGIRFIESESADRITRDKRDSWMLSWYRDEGVCETLKPPRHPYSKHANMWCDLHYWLGRALLGERNYEGALAANEAALWCDHAIFGAVSVQMDAYQKLFEGARVSQIALEGAGDALYALSRNDGKRQEVQMAFNYYIQCSSSTKSAISVKGMNCLLKATLMVLLDNIQITPEACEVLKIYSSLLKS